MNDIRSPKLLYAKAFLFLLLGSLASGLLLAAHPTLKVAILLAVAIWAFCRAYYFVFYVVERYVDPRYKFAGLWSLARFALAARRAADDSGESAP